MDTFPSFEQLHGDLGSSDMYVEMFDLWGFPQGALRDAGEHEH